MKSLYDISWQVSEEEYRADKALSYSTLAKYERGGFNSIPTLFDKVESPSLLFGSCVDSIITGGYNEFQSRFMVADIPNIAPTVLSITKMLFNDFGNEYDDINDIPNDIIIEYALRVNYQNNWKPETRAKVIKENGAAYYKLLYLCEDRIIVSLDMYTDVVNAVDALKTSAATSYYFQCDDPMSSSIERLYQLKFKATLNNVDYRCMFDELIIFHDTKEIQPIDLKTSHKKEYDFYKSFVEWNYQIQNRLYVRILQENIKNDEYFKDFKILPYKDIVVCKDNLDPMVWDCPFTFDYGTLVFGKNKQIEMRDPEEIGKELSYYLANGSKRPIDINDENDITKWLNKI